jgi:hypothetical protein
VQALENGLTTFGEVLKGQFPELGEGRVRFPFQPNPSFNSGAAEDAPTTPSMANIPQHRSSPTPWAIVATRGVTPLLLRGAMPVLPSWGWPSPHLDHVEGIFSLSPSSSTSGLPANQFEQLTDSQSLAVEDMDIDVECSKSEDREEVGSGH